MKIVEYTIKDALGIHARPAGVRTRRPLQLQCRRSSRVICKDFISPGVNGDEIGGRKRSSALPSVNTIGRFGGPQNKEGKLL